MRVVIKVGTSLIAPGGQIDINLLRGMVDQFDLSKNEYLIVTSGAIAAGMSGLGSAEASRRCSAHAGLRRGRPEQADAYLRAAVLRQEGGRAIAAFERRLHFAGALPQSAERAGRVAGAGRGAHRERERQRLGARVGRRLRRQRRVEFAAGHRRQSGLAAAADQRRRIPGSQRPQEAASAAGDSQTDARD